MSLVQCLCVSLLLIRDMLHVVVIMLMQGRYILSVVSFIPTPSLKKEARVQYQIN